MIQSKVNFYPVPKNCGKIIGNIIFWEENFFKTNLYLLTAPYKNASESKLFNSVWSTDTENNPAFHDFFKVLTTSADRNRQVKFNLQVFCGFIKD